MDEEREELDFENGWPDHAWSLRELCELAIDEEQKGMEVAGNFEEAYEDFREQNPFLTDESAGAAFARGLAIVEDEDRLNLKRSRRYDFRPFGSESARVEHHNNRDTLGGDLTTPQWLALCEAFGGCCAYCGKEVKRQVLEHVRPICCGGRTTLDNVLPSCWACNMSKGIESLNDWQQDPEWWIAFIGRVVAAATKLPKFKMRKRARVKPGRKKKRAR